MRLAFRLFHLAADKSSTRDSGNREGVLQTQLAILFGRIGWLMGNGFRVGQGKVSGRQWHPTPALLPGNSHGWRSLVRLVHGVARSRTRLSDFTFTSHLHALEKEMATHSSILAWRIPGTGEPGGLLSLESHRVGHDWSDLAAAAAVPPHCSFSKFFGSYFVSPYELLD